MRKTIVVIASAALGIAAASVGLASEDLAKKSGCMGCHDVNTKKVGPSFKSVAASFKGKPDAEKTILGVINDPKKHPATKASDADKQALVKWVLSQ